MKLKELTKDQRSSIEADEVGKEILKLLGYLKEHKLSDIGWGSKWSIQSEIKRTIKRIDDEIEWIWEGNKQLSVKELRRHDKLKKQKQLYELMEQLE